MTTKHNRNRNRNRTKANHPRKMYYGTYRIDEHDPAYDPNDPNQPMHAFQESEGLTKLEVAMTVVYAVAVFVLLMDVFVWRP